MTYSDEIVEKRRKWNESKFGDLRNLNIEELKKRREELLLDNEYMRTHATSSFQQSEFEGDIRFQNEEISYIDDLLNKYNYRR